MTTLHFHSTLPYDAKVAEDPMELTTDADRRLAADQDIDIDVDLTDEQDSEDEFMSEDIDGPISGPLLDEQQMRESDDDEMEDDIQGEGAPLEQESVADEDLGNADIGRSGENGDSVLDFLHQSGPDANLDPSTQNQMSSLNNQGEGQEHLHSKTKQAQPREAHLPSVPQALTVAAHDTFESKTQELSKDVESEDSTRAQVSTQQDGYDPSDHVSYNQESEVESQHHSPASGPLPDQEAVVSSDDILTQIKRPFSDEDDILPSSWDDAVNTGSAQEAGFDADSIARTEVLASPASYLHPVSILYQSDEFSLFPPNEEEEQHLKTFFLQNEEYADASISSLFGALRSVLGESISGGDELVISFEDLGLDISESDAEFTTSTLRSLINTYVDLQHNDDIESPPPLLLRLITRLRFNYRLEYLANAAAEGKGLSRVQQLRPHAADEQEKASHNTGEKDRKNSREADELKVPKSTEHSEHQEYEDVAGKKEEEEEADEEEEKEQVNRSENEDEDEHQPGQNLHLTLEVPQDTVPPGSIDDSSKQSVYSDDSHSVSHKIADQAGAMDNSQPMAIPMPNSSLKQLEISKISFRGNQDSVEYDEEEEWAPEVSSGSSTLQDDVLTDQRPQEGLQQSARYTTHSASIHSLVDDDDDSVVPTEAPVTMKEPTSSAAYDLGDVEYNDNNEEIGHYQDDTAYHEVGIGPYRISGETNQILNSAQAAVNPDQSQRDTADLTNDLEAPRFIHEQDPMWSREAREPRDGVNVDQENTEKQETFSVQQDHNDEPADESAPNNEDVASQSQHQGYQPGFEDLDAVVEAAQGHNEPAEPGLAQASNKELEAMTVGNDSDSHKGDEDEISYEEEDDVNNPPQRQQEQSEYEQKDPPNSDSLKRSRDFCEDDLQGAKRVRS